jgi:putative oxidoreductase
MFLLLRLLGGGALVLAGVIKAGGNPHAFALSISSFKLVPDVFVAPLAYYLPWFEILVGLALVLGLWGRQAGLLAGLLYAGFTLGLASVLVRGLNADCGCFGGLFGAEEVGWPMILRNVILMSSSLAIAVFGEGRFALLRDGVGNEVAGTPSLPPLADVPRES